MSAVQRYRLLTESLFRCSRPIEINFNETKSFSSPNYPENYDNSLFCTFPIVGPEGSVLQFESEDFSLEGVAPPVCRDTLTFTDYPNPNEARGVSYCGTKGPDQLRSTTNKVVSHKETQRNYINMDNEKQIRNYIEKN